MRAARIGCAAISFSIAVVLVFFSAQAFAQTDSGTVSGRVLDPTGRNVFGAKVRLIDIDRGISEESVTNNAGLYTFRAVHPGRYRLEVEAKGFKLVNITGLTVNTQANLEQNFALSIGSVSESVTVSADSVKIDTTDSTVSTVVDRNFVENTALNGRSLQDLISMTPGVVNRNPNSGGSNGQSGDFSVNGQRTESNYYTVDGVSANIGAGVAANGSFVGGDRGASGSLAAGTVLGTTQSLVSIDALQEFRVQSSTYSAEYGRAPGGQFSFLTRSGTNDLHGTLFEYLRNDYFDANDWFNNHLGKPASALRQNDFGGTLGGPVQIPHFYHGKDKTFFFVSYEGLRLVQPQAASTSVLVPDTFMRQQAPPALQSILNAFPVPNGKDFGTAAAPSLAQFVQPFSSPSNIDSTSIRVDHTFGPKASLFFRLADTPSSAQTRGSGGSASIVSVTSLNTQTYTLGMISVLSGKASNDLRLGYAKSATTIRGVLDGFGGAVPVDLAAAMGAGSSPGAFLTMQISIPGVGLSLLRESSSSNRLRQWNLVDTFSVALGRHQLKIGADYRKIISPNIASSPTITPVYLNGSQVITNTPAAIAVANSLSATPIFNETSIFVQDEWRLSPRLNVSLGTRWEIDPPPHGADGQDAYTLLGSISNPSSLTLAPRGTPLWHTSWYNFAPRLGMAWKIHNSPGWETVIRSGGGVFFDTNNQTAAEGFSGLGFAASKVYSGVSLPVTPAQLNITPSVLPPFSNNIYLFPSHLQLPYTLQWNVSVQQAMGSNQALTLSYVGSAARRMTGQQTLSLASFNPSFGAGRLVYWTSNLTSDYDALQVQFQRSVSRGVHALASYTWSHCLDVGSSYGALSTAPGIGQIAFRRGNCDLDVRHSFQGGVSWELPHWTGSRIAQDLMNQWGLDARLMARTAFPVSLNGRTLVDPITGVTYTSGVDLVANQPIYRAGSEFPGGREINPAAFTVPVGPLGNAPRNFVRGFGSWQINMAMRREFPIREKLSMQFRAEAFNILNHPNFGQVDPTLSSATFGQALTMLNQALGTVASQYQQGGPRSMQFALKVRF